ncbi:MAG: hypothetical protein R2831_04220 [Chitinophagaceae bacterium]
MKKLILSLSVLVGLAMLNSCGETAMDPAQVEAKVNEAAAVKIEEANAQANTECEARMATELKAATDSLVHAAQMAAAQ